MNVVLRTEAEGLLPNQTGKVRDIYEKGNDYLLIVTTDRISAYDAVMPQGIPFKGRVLHGLTKWWMQNLDCPNHFVTDNLNEIGEPFNQHPDVFAGRSMLVRKLIPLPIEAIIRGHLCGSAWKEYTKTGHVCGVRLPLHMNQNQHFFKPIFTPSTKAQQGKHDENITCQQMEQILGGWLAGLKPPDGVNAKELEFLAHQIAGLIHTKSVNLYIKAASLLWDKGIIMADTKLEWAFQLDTWGPDRGSPKLILIDEAFTPDSSRFWDFKHYSLGGSVRSLDKQTLRDWLDSGGPLGCIWNRISPPPNLPEDLIDKLSKNYLAIYERITGSKLEVEA